MAKCIGRKIADVSIANSRRIMKKVARPRAYPIRRYLKAGHPSVKLWCYHVVRRDLQSNIYRSNTLLPFLVCPTSYNKIKEETVCPLYDNEGDS